VEIAAAISQGETLEEAKTNLQDALQLVLGTSATWATMTPENSQQAFLLHNKPHRFRSFLQESFPDELLQPQPRL